MSDIDNSLIDALAWLTDNSVFNEGDAILGRELAFWGLRCGFLTDLQRMTAGRMIKRYRRHLEKAGFDVKTILKGRRRGRKIIRTFKREQQAYERGDRNPQRDASVKTRKSIWDY